MPWAQSSAASVQLDELRFDDLRDDVAKLTQTAIANFPRMRLGGSARRADGQRHVGIFGVGEDEILAAARVGVDAGQLGVE